MSEKTPPDPQAIVPADSVKALSLPAEMINRGLALATKLEQKRSLQRVRTPLKQCPPSYSPACVTFSKNGRFALITGYGERGASPNWILWDVADSSRTIALLTQLDPVFAYSAALSRNGELALIGYDDGRIDRWDIAKGTARTFPADTRQLCSPNRKVLPAKFSPGQAFEDQRTTPQAKRKRSTTDQFYPAVTTLAISPDGECFAEGVAHWQLRIRDTTWGRTIHHFPVGSLEYSNQMAFSEDSSQLAVVGRLSFSTSEAGWRALITLLDLNGIREPLPLGDRTGEVNAVAFFPDGQKVLSLETGGLITVWDAVDGHDISHWSHGQSPEDTQNPVSKKPGPGNRTFETRNPMIWGLSGVAVSPDGQRLLSGGGDTYMRLWSLDGRQIAEYPHSTRVVSVAFTPDGRQALSGCWDGSAYLWEMP